MTDYFITEWWSARKRDDGTLEPHQRISGVGIEPSPSNIETYGIATISEMALADLAEFGRIKAGDPLFLVHTKFQLIAGNKDAQRGPHDGDKDLPVAKQIDFKSLLLRYMAHVGEREGDMFLDDTAESGELFTAEELTMLHQIEADAIETYWPNGRWEMQGGK